MTRFVNASARQTDEAKLKALKGIDPFLFESFALMLFRAGSMRPYWGAWCS